MLIDGIGELVTNDPDLGDGPLGLRRNAAVVIDDGRVAWVGSADAVPEGAQGPRVDAGQRAVIPGFVDSHTHLVFAGDRAEEFAARLAGRPYETGGIRTTVAATRSADDAALRRRAGSLAAEALRQGTTTLELKSGYGLTVDDERRSLRIAGELAAGEGDHDTAPGPLPAVVPTFLGGHVVPDEYAHGPDEYVRLVCGPMLEACASLTRWCDVFCETGAFDADQSRAILAAGRAHGLGLRVHANQLGFGPGARLAAEMGAASADHLNHLTEGDVAALADAGVVATLLPGVDFSTRAPWAPGRRLRDAGATVALASDCNPGTSYTTSMPMVVAWACREYGLTPDEAVWAATAGGARALALTDGRGTLTPGAPADAVVLDAPSHLHLAYRPGVPLTTTVVQGGRIAHTR